MNTYPINVAIAEDNALLLSSLTSTLHKLDVFHVTCKVSNGAQLLEQMEINPPHVAIINYNMPELNGIQATKQIKSNSANVKIIGTTCSPNQLKIANFFRAGADAVMTGRNEAHELIDAVVHLHEKGFYYNDHYYQFIKHLAQKSYPRPHTINPWMALDDIDLLIIKMTYYDELTHEEIAQKLKYITRKTVDQRAEKMTKLLNCKRFIGVIRICIEHKIISADFNP